MFLCSTLKAVLDYFSQTDQKKKSHNGLRNIKRQSLLDLAIWPQKRSLLQQVYLIRFIRNYPAQEEKK